MSLSCYFWDTNYLHPQTHDRNVSEDSDLPPPYSIDDSPDYTKILKPYQANIVDLNIILLTCNILDQANIVDQNDLDTDQ